MPRYHLNLDLDNQVLCDRDGQEFRDPDAAADVARVLARGLIQTARGMRSGWLSCRVQVTDERGDIVSDLPLMEAAGMERVA
jgi:hypothetical protein